MALSMGARRSPPTENFSLKKALETLSHFNKMFGRHELGCGGSLWFLNDGGSRLFHETNCNAHRKICRMIEL
jgi:hypothetical protein